MHIDLNCDIGEGMGFDEAIFPLISSANIACGGHFGDKDTIERAVELATENSVQIGAHLSFPDMENFGREVLAIEQAELKASLHEQFDSLKIIAGKLGQSVTYIKPHGALYHVVNKQRQYAELFLSFVESLNASIKIMGMPGSVLSEVIAKTNLVFVREGFADRRYVSATQLQSRKEVGSVFSDPVRVGEQAINLCTRNLETIEGKAQISVDSICIHSDTKGALEHFKWVRSLFQEKGIEVKAF